MAKSLPIISLLTSSLFLVPLVAHADLVPPGGEGVNACRDKKAGESCQNYVIDESGQRLEPGTCVEEKLDHLHFKFKAHLRCVSPSVPTGGASAKPATPVPSASTAPSVAPPVPSASAITPVPSTPIAAETPKSSMCSWTGDPSSGMAFGFFLLGLGVLFGARRHTR